MLCALLGPLMAQAESQIWVRNHTNEALEIQTEARSGVEWQEGEHWFRGMTRVAPGTVAEIARVTRRRRHVDRDGGHIIAQVGSADSGQPMTLRTSVRRSLCGTTLQSGVGGMSAAGLHWTLGARPMSVIRAQEARPWGGFPFCQGGDERIEYLIEDLSPLPEGPKSGPDDLLVMTYNIWYLLGKPRQAKRWIGIPEVVSGNDVVVFTEAFKSKYRALLMEALRDEYPYMTEVLDGGGSLINGGVFVVSKWPFGGLEKTSEGLYVADQHVFSGDECSGEDCFAAKGIQYAPIRKNGRTYHLFATHLQSTTPVFQSVRRATNSMMAQTRRVGSWVASKGISEHEPVLIAGDLNFDANEHAVREQALINLKARMPETVGVLRHSYMMDTPKSAQSALDHVLYSRWHRQPVSATQEILLPPGLLSDHFPVRALYAYGEK